MKTHPRECSDAAINLRALCSTASNTFSLRASINCLFTFHCNTIYYPFPRLYQCDKLAATATTKKRNGYKTLLYFIISSYFITNVNYYFGVYTSGLFPMGIAACEQYFYNNFHLVETSAEKKLTALLYRSCKSIFHPILVFRSENINNVALKACGTICCGHLLS